MIRRPTVIVNFKTWWRNVVDESTNTTRPYPDPANPRHLAAVRCPADETAAIVLALPSDVRYETWQG